MHMCVMLGVCGEPRRSVGACGRCDGSADGEGSIFPPPGARPEGLLRRSARLEVRLMGNRWRLGTLEWNGVLGKITDKTFPVSSVERRSSLAPL